jgi:hypothetical protein
MKQSQLPKFISIQFYPGYVYTVGCTTCSAAGRYVAIAEDGRAYSKYLDGPGWEMIADKDEDG